MRPVDEHWSKERIAHRLRRRGLTARLRFSTSKNLARIDVYCRAGLSEFVEAALTERGWQRAGAHDDVPEGAVGHIYRHTDASVEHYRSTRDLIMQEIGMEDTPPAESVREAIDDVRISPAEVPRDYLSFHRWINFACVEWYLPLQPMSFHAQEGLRCGDDSAFHIFMKAYDAFWAAPEDEKFKQMHPDQRTSPRRLDFLRRAKEVVYPQR